MPARPRHPRAQKRDGRLSPGGMVLPGAAKGKEIVGVDGRHGRRDSSASFLKEEGAMGGARERRRARALGLNQQTEVYNGNPGEEGSVKNGHLLRWHLLQAPSCRPPSRLQAPRLEIAPGARPQPAALGSLAEPWR